MAIKPKKHDNPLHHPVRPKSKPGAAAKPSASSTPSPAAAPSPQIGKSQATQYGSTPQVSTSVPAAVTPSKAFTPATPGSAGSSTAPLATGSFDVFTSTFGDLASSQIYLGNPTLQHGMGQIRTGSDAPIRAKSTIGPAESTTVDTYARQFAQLSVTSPKAFAAQQLELYQAGFYGSTPPKFGVFTTSDLGALKGAFESYSAVVNPTSPTPLTFADYMDHAAAQITANGGMGGVGGGGAQRAPLSLTDPTELNQTLQSAAQSALGRNLNDAELKTFVSHFHGLEQTAYNKANGGSTYTSPDVTGQAMTEVDQQHAAEESQKLKAGYEDTIQQLLGVK